MTDLAETHSGYRVGLADEPDTLLVEKDGLARKIPVPPLSRIAVTGEVRSMDDSARWPILPQRSRRTPNGVWPVPGPVLAEGVRVYRISDDGERRLLEAGSDYEIDAEFAGITPEDHAEAVYSLDYEMRLQRLDVLAEKDGELRLFRGAEALTGPPWPKLPPGWLGLARVYLRFCDSLGESAIWPVHYVEHARLVNVPAIAREAKRRPSGSVLGRKGEAAGLTDPDHPTWPTAIDYAPHVLAGAGALDRLRRRVRESDPLRVVYFGDSTTHGGDVDPDYRYTVRLSRALDARFPEKRFAFVNAAIGGTNSTFGRSRFDADVLAHEPDIVTVLFLNVRGIDDEAFAANYRAFLDKLRERGAELVLLTSNMNTGIWMDRLDYAERRVVDFAREHDLVCLDAYAVWKSLPEYGIPYETLLANGINHPDSVADGVFYELLRRAFFGDRE
jgi:lysophospholipase L1-like esterase